MDVAAKVAELNALFREIQAYKEEHPETKSGYYFSVPSLLNCYREGDISFEDCVREIQLLLRPAPYVERTVTTTELVHNPEYPSEALCTCNHPYYRHFDSYDSWANIGCEYCGCLDFKQSAQ